MSIKRYLHSVYVLLFFVLSQGIFAETVVDFNESQIIEQQPLNQVLINTIRVDTRLAAGQEPVLTEYYKILFQFNPQTLHLEPIQFDLLQSIPNPPPPTNQNCAQLQVKAVDSDTGKIVQLADVQLGQTLRQSTNSKGETLFIQLSPNIMTLSVTHPDFMSNTQQLTLHCQGINEVTVSLQPQRKSNETLIAENAAKNIRIVLDWGTTPRDLDAHLTGPAPLLPASYNNEAGRFHLYFGDTNVENGLAVLQVDQFSATKPEVIEIKLQAEQLTLPVGSYRFTVHQFSGSGNLVDSKASVSVWINNQLTQTFFPTKEGSDILTGKIKDIWRVFELKIAENGLATLHPLQSYDVNIEPSGVR